MVIIAWVLAIIFSSPQAIVFRVLKHPVIDAYQCTTINFYESLSTPHPGPGNTTILLLAGLTPIQVADLYHTIFNAQVFFIPLIIIVVMYVKIYLLLKR
jgi:hypothetical protein